MVENRGVCIYRLKKVSQKFEVGKMFWNIFHMLTKATFIENETVKTEILWNITTI